jgi:hypothetical protein
LKSKEPSPLIGYSVVNLLHAYVITARYFVGEHHINAPEAVEVIVALSAALSKNFVFETLDAAVTSVEEKAHDVWVFHFYANSCVLCLYRELLTRI